MRNNVTANGVTTSGGLESFFLPLADEVSTTTDPRIIDLTARADKSRRILTRDPKKVYALVLHQMACCFKVRDPLTRFLKMAPHFAILPDGRILQLHPILSLTGASNGFNPGSVAVEFAGNFPDTRGKWWHGPQNGQNQVTAAQIEAGRYLVRYLIRTMGLKVIVAHRQSSGTRDNDPGPDIWYHVGQWAVDTLGLKDGGPGFKTGTGKPIPDLWRTWGKVKPQPEFESYELEIDATKPPNGGAQLPQAVRTALNFGLEGTAIKLAATLGYRDANTLTNVVFFARHPERNGRKLVSSEPGFAKLSQEWRAIRDGVVSPALGGRASAPSPSRRATLPNLNELVSKLNKYRGDVPLSFLLGWVAVESGGRLGTVTKSLNERGYFQNHPGESKTLGLDHDRLSADPDYSVWGGIQLVKYGAKRAQAVGFGYGSDLSWGYSKLLHWLPLGVKVIVEDMKRQGFKPASWKDFRDYVLREQQRLAEVIKNQYTSNKPHLRSWTLPPKWYPQHGIGVVDRVFEQGRQLVAGLASPSSTEFQLEPFRLDEVELEAATGSCADVPVPVSRRPKLLVRGSIHSAVREVQRKLNAFHAYRVAAGLPGLRDSPLAADCNFGEHTFEAVKSFQELVFPGMPIEHDGKVGPHTWAQLDAVVVGPGTSPAVQFTVDRLRIVDDGFTRPLSWDEVIGLDTLSLNVEFGAVGMPSAVMPAQITIEISSRSPNRAGGSVTLGTTLKLAAARVRADPTNVNRMTYRLSRPLANLGEFLKVERKIKEVTTIVRSGGSSDVSFRRALGWNSRGIGTQPTSAGASTGVESGEIPDAFALFRAAGVEVLEVRVPAQPNWQVPGSFKRLVRSPADVVYYSGHGLSGSGKLGIDTKPKPCPEHGSVLDWLGPADLTPVWISPMDLDILILAGCSVLKINFTSPPTGPGVAWSKLLRAKGGPLSALLGYAGKAPCDSPNGERIALQMAQRLKSGSTSFARDWLTVNGDNNANLAVAMDDQGYWWIEETWTGDYDIKGPRPIP